MASICILPVAAASACVLASGLCAGAESARLGNLKAGAILFLGNSITVVPPPNYWGASASSAANDYVHLLTERLNTAAKGSLTLTPPQPPFGRWYPGDPGPDWDGNVLNIADIFERNYGTWDNARVRKQLALKPDLVVLQFGENMPMAAFDADAFRSALRKLLGALKEGSDPTIFVTSFILGRNEAVDSIKREVCAEDPARRVFVDLGDIGPDATGGAFAHPNDRGMSLIAERLFNAVEASSGGGQQAL